MNGIERFLPQRPPFLFVDRIISADRELIVGEKIYGADFAFGDCIFGNCTVPGMILLESLMQCGGAGARMMKLSGDAVFALAAVDRADMKEVVYLPAAVTMKVENIRLRRRALFQRGTSFLEGEPVLSAAWHCLAMQG